MRTGKRLLYIALAALGLRTLSMILWPTALAWDGAVYIGMGRFIATAGHTGLWELYRPAFLPLLFSVGTLLSVPITWAVSLTILASFGSLYLAYTIGERYMPTAGGWASIVLATSTLFATFTTIPTTEIFGVFGFLLAFFILFVRRGYAWGGVVAALLFLLRFPYGLLLPIFGVALVAQSWLETKNVVTVARRTACYAGGALVIVAAYLLANMLVYGNAFLTITEGARVARAVGYLYIEHPLYYLGVLVLGAPLVLLVGVPVYAFRRLPQPVRTSVGMLLGTAVIFFAYFSMELHKEARYIMPAFAPLSVVAGFGIAHLFAVHSARRSRAILIAIVCALVAAGYILMIHAHIGFQKDRGLQPYYKTFDQYSGSTVISSTPIISAFADVRLVGAYTTFDEYERELAESPADYLYINSCDLVQCQASGNCTKELGAFLDDITPRVQVTTIASHNQCQIVMGEVKN